MPLHVGHKQPQGFSCTPNHLDYHVVMSKNPISQLGVYFLYKQLSSCTLNLAKWNISS